MAHAAGVVRAAPPLHTLQVLQGIGSEDCRDTEAAEIGGREMQSCCSLTSATKEVWHQAWTHVDLAGCCARCTASSQFRSRKSAPTVELPWRVHRGRKHRSDCCESAERMLHEAHLEADAEAGGVVRRGALRAAHQLPAVPADLHTITDTCD